jgi:cytochrome oxidase Cu insertion factor (SCO1/SenC/PrrC family)
MHLLAARIRGSLRRVPALIAGLALATAIHLGNTASAEDPTLSDAGTTTASATAAAEFDYHPPVPGSYQLPVIKTAADGAVLDAAGSPRQLRELTRGAITVMSFIYTRCTDTRACPFATGVLRHVHKLAGEDSRMAGHVRLISLSFDPEVDTPQRMRAYAEWARNRDLPVDWHFLTTRSQVELKPILEAYGQAVDRRRNPGAPEGPLFHTLRVFLIDQHGHIRNIYGADTLDPRLVMADIQTLLLDDGQPTAASQESP